MTRGIPAMRLKHFIKQQGDGHTVRFVYRQIAGLGPDVLKYAQLALVHAHSNTLYGNVRSVL